MLVRIQMKSGNVSREHTGKGKFFARLCRELEKIGVAITYDKNTDVDIDVCINRPLYWPKNAKKRIIRLGPVEYDTNRKDLREMWHIARKYINFSHGIVYQSEFSRQMNYDFLGKPEGKKEVVIFNGADREYYKTVDPYPSKFGYNFLASTREWVWEKRLIDIIKSFKLAAVEDSCLWIAGQVWDKPKRFPPKQKDFKEKYGSDNIKFLGQCDEELVGSLYRLCNAMIHICYVDACPNAVAEALCAGCRVIANNVGGQAEMIVPTVFDKPRPDRAWNRREPPGADRQEIAKQIQANARPRELLDVSRVDIKNISKQYAVFFEKVLHG